MNIFLNKKTFICLFFIFSALFPFLSCGADDDIVFHIQGRQLFLNGESFTVKGVNYSPVPIGASFDDGDKIGDVFFDYFNPIHQIDFEYMREMGANTIRIYGIFPWHPLEGPKNPRDHSNFLNLAYNNGEGPIYIFASYPISSSIFRYRVADHKPTDNSFYVILPTGPNGSDQIWVMDEQQEQEGFTWLGKQNASQRRESDRQAYLALAKKYKDHPAILGWVIGNELNSPQNRVNPAYWEYLNSLAGELKEITPNKITMVTLIDDGMITLKKVKELGVDVSHIDVWGINSYRGNVHEGQNNFGRGEGSLFKQYAAVSDIPLIISEFGPSSTTRQEIIDENLIPTEPKDMELLVQLCPNGVMTELPDNAALAALYIEGHWEDIIRHRSIVSGGIVFEWQDEYWKAGDQHQQTLSKATNVDFPGGCWDEEGFGIMGVRLKRSSSREWPYPFVPDERLPRAQYEVLRTLWKNQ